MSLLFILKEVLTELIFWYMSKDDAINIMNGSNFADKNFCIIYKNEGKC